MQSLDLWTYLQEDIREAESILGRIGNLFFFCIYRGSVEAVQISSLSGRIPALYDSAIDLDRATAALHQTIRDPAIRRQGQSGLRYKL